MQRFYRFSTRGVLRDLALTLLIGASIGVVLWLGDGERESWWLVPVATWFVLCTYAVVSVTLALFSRTLARLTSWRLYLLLVPLMFLASTIGFYLGVQSLPILNPLMRLISGENPPWLLLMFATPDWGTMLASAGALGVIVGVLFFRYELLKNRLRDSVARLKESEHAERELETARRIQRRILGPTFLEGRGYRVSAENRPALYVAGDFYDVFTRAEGTLDLVAADVSGKGMAASLVMASVKGRLPLLAEPRGVAETLVELSRSLRRELDRREFVALCYVRYSAATGDFELANAGLPDPYVLVDGSPPRALSVPGPRLPLGLKDEFAYESLAGRLEVGERLLLLTDGPPEAPLPDGAPLGYAALERMLAQGEGPTETRLIALFDALEAKVGTSREDDWTALLLERSE